MRSNRERNLVAFELLRGAAAIALALAVAAVLIFLTSKQPFTALRYLLIGPLVSIRGGVAGFNTQGFFTILAATIPTIFTGLAVCVMFSSNQFNLAGEGVVMAGGFVAALCGIYLHMASGWHAAFCVLVAAAVGGLIMLVPALLKVKLGANEMVTSLMLNYVCLFVVLHFLNYVFADRSKGSTQTFPFDATAQIPAMVPGVSKLSWAFVAALIFTALAGLFMYRTRWGYAIRMIGVNQAFARYSGMRVGGTIVLSQVVGGVLSGIGGGVEILGRYSTFLWKDLPGFGWTGITIAILAKNNPLLVPLAAFFIAYLNKGCQLMATYCDVPSEMIDIIQAAIFLFFAAEQFLSGWRQRLVVKNARAELAKADAQGGAE